jgi:hypothetical protein
MFFGRALVAEPCHTLLGTGAFSHLSACFGFCGGAGRAREGRTGKNEGEDADEEEPEPKCHCDHYHLVPGKILAWGISARPEKIVGQEIETAEIRTCCDGKGNLPSRAKLNCPSTEVSTFLHNK